MLRWIPVVVEIGLLVYALLDCIQTDSVAVRNLPKSLWVVLIVFVPIVGSVAWLVAGRPERSGPTRRVPWPGTATAGFPEYERPRGPDDDAQFLAGLRESDATHEQMLKDWEDQLRERERKLREGEGDDGPTDTATGQHPGKDR